MKKTATIVALAFVLVAALPALSGDEVNLTGWVTDACCGAKNANAKGKDCTLACHKNGQELTFHADGKDYRIDDQEAALKHVGHEVVVKGHINEEGILEIASISPAKKDKTES